MAGEPEISVEVAWALPDRQMVVPVVLPAGATAADAIAASGLAEQIPGFDPERSPVGIYARRVAPSTVLQDGDRVELYRPLAADPGQSRRERAIRRNVRKR